MLKKLILTIFLLCVQIVFAQNNFSIDKEKIRRLVKSASELEYTNWSQAQILIDKADRIATQSNDKELQAWFHADAATIYYDRDIFDVSLKYSMEAYYFK